MQHPFLYKPELDQRRARWAVERCRGGAHDALQTIVPSGFDSYVRLCQPAWRWSAIDPDDKPAWKALAAGWIDFKRATPVRWCDIAQENDRQAHRLMQWHTIAPPAPTALGASGITAPIEYEITLPMVELLFDVLIRHTGESQECVCAFWEGYANLDHLRRPKNTLTEGIGQQAYFLYNASLSEVRDQWRLVLTHRREAEGFAPNALWPTTQDWYFAVPIGPMTPYFGGPANLVSDIHRVPGLETYEAFPEDNIWVDETSPG